MKVLYLDCGMGAAGDMLSAALLELMPDPDAFIAELNALGIPGVEVVRKRSTRAGTAGTRLSVRVHGVVEGEESAAPDQAQKTQKSERRYGIFRAEKPEKHEEHHHHHHRDLAGVQSILQKASLDPAVRRDVLAVYDLLAGAESEAHGVPVTEIHFHEVGQRDAITDITAACMLMRRIAPDQVIASPVHVGSGQVRCAHGTLPVPAPAAAILLRGIPHYSGDIYGELCTPTGAALLRYFVSRFGDMPPMRVLATGYGLGHREFERPNCLRAVLGTAEEAAPDRIPAVPQKPPAASNPPEPPVRYAARAPESPSAASAAGRVEPMLELSCHVDDMTGEELGFALERLLDAGAKDAFTIPIGMKKSRPGVLLRVLCEASLREEMIRLLFLHTSTSGVREAPVRRYILDRTVETVPTPYGPVRRKRVSGFGVERTKYEYEDLARIARELGVSIARARALTEEQEERA